MKDLHEIKAMVFVIMLCAIFMVVHDWFILDSALRIRFSVETIAREIARLNK